MQKEMYIEIEKYMLSCMRDAAHDCQHVYRVLYLALDLAKNYDVSNDVLIAACLLHDIGREAQFKNPECEHSTVGADMAFKFLNSIGWDKYRANHVKSCIFTHSYRKGRSPESLEAKILFDADKLDVIGAIGIARTLMYVGIESEPLYSLDEYSNVMKGDKDTEPSFFHEYQWKLKDIHEKLYTDKAKIIAEERRKAGMSFFESMYNEVTSIHKTGIQLLKDSLENL